MMTKKIPFEYKLDYSTYGNQTTLGLVEITKAIDTYESLGCPSYRSLTCDDNLICPSKKYKNKQEWYTFIGKMPISDVDEYIAGIEKHPDVLEVDDNCLLYWKDTVTGITDKNYLNGYLYIITKRLD